MGRELKVSLAALNGGAVEEVFQHVLAQVLENIDDVNTEAKKPREIAIKIKLLPSDDRAMIAVDVAITSKVPSVKSMATTLYVQKDSLGITATEYRPKQDQLAFIGEKGAKVNG